MRYLYFSFIIKRIKTNLYKMDFKVDQKKEHIKHIRRNFTEE